MSKAISQIECLENISVKMRDGVTLSLRIWRPKDIATPLPAIVEHLPYRKRDGTAVRDALTHPYFAQNGYISVRVDMRGNGDSEGVMDDEYTETEWQDALDVFQWLEAQPWCNGNIGMMGISWGGFNGLQLAALQPQQLKAVITLCSTVDRFAEDIHYKGGALLNENHGWGATMWSYSSRPPDPMLVGEDWRDMWLKRLEHEPFLPSIWLRHQARDEYWKHGSICEDFSKIQAKVLAIGGWGDAYKNAVGEIVKNIDGAKGIIGPWVHKYPHFAVPEPRIGFLQIALSWWDRWLKGIENDVEAMPDMQEFILDHEPPKPWYETRKGRFVGIRDFKQFRTDIKTFHLTPKGLRKKASPLSVSIKSPLHTGRDAGEYCAIWLGPELPGDQRLDDAMSCIFDTKPQKTPITICGRARLTFTFSTSNSHGNLIARLCDVAPDGSSTRISYGVINLTAHKSFETPQKLTPGQVYEGEIALDDIAYEIPKGHKLRIALCTNYWPLLWPAKTNGEATIHEAWLALPLSNNLKEVNFPPPEAAPALMQREIRPPHHIRQTTLDAVTQSETLKIIDDFGEYENLEHGLITGSIARETYAMNKADPFSAFSEIHWTQALSRGEWSVRTETYSTMTADADNFYLTAKLEAYENETLVFEKSIEDEIPREFV